MSRVKANGNAKKTIVVSSPGAFLVRRAYNHLYSSAAENEIEE